MIVKNQVKSQSHEKNQVQSYSHEHKNQVRS